MRVLGISGSLRRDSHNTKLLRAAGGLLEAEGAEFVLYDGLKDVPPYDEDDDIEGGTGAAVERLRDAVAQADAVLFATPEYNGSIPGQLKNAVDWLSRPRGSNALLNKRVAVIGASTGMFGAVWAQADLKKVLATAGARVSHEGEVPVPQADTRFHDDGGLNDEQIGEQIRQLMLQLLDVLEPARVPV
jgi:chromate reductase, NAD(P)H dehydrogenase (quinone)